MSKSKSSEIKLEKNDKKHKHGISQFIQCCETSLFFIDSFQVQCSKICLNISLTHLCRTKEWTIKVKLKFTLRLMLFSQFGQTVEAAAMSLGKCRGSVMRNRWWNMTMTPIYSIDAIVFFFLFPSHLVIHILFYSLEPTIYYCFIDFCYFSYHSFFFFFFLWVYLPPVQVSRPGVKSEPQLQKCH